MESEKRNGSSIIPQFDNKTWGENDDFLTRTWMLLQKLAPLIVYKRSSQGTTRWLVLSGRLGARSHVDLKFESNTHE